MPRVSCVSGSSATRMVGAGEEGVQAVLAGEGGAGPRSSLGDRLQPATSKPITCELAGRILPELAEPHDADPHASAPRRRKRIIVPEALALLAVVARAADADASGRAARCTRSSGVVRSGSTTRAIGTVGQHRRSAKRWSTPAPSEKIALEVGQPGQAARRVLPARDIMHRTAVEGLAQHHDRAAPAAAPGRRSRQSSTCQPVMAKSSVIVLTPSVIRFGDQRATRHRRLSDPYRPCRKRSLAIAKTRPRRVHERCRAAAAAHPHRRNPASSTSADGMIDRVLSAAFGRRRAPRRPSPMARVSMACNDVGRLQERPASRSAPRHRWRRRRRRADRPGRRAPTTMRAKRSAAAPLAKASSILARAASRSAARLAEQQHLGGERHRRPRGSAVRDCGRSGDRARRRPPAHCRQRRRVARPYRSGAP